MTSLSLFGRERELRVLIDLTDHVQERGEGVVVRGDAGMGKSALLAATRSGATDRGFRVLSATGVLSEAHIPFAGLQQLLQPILSHVDELLAAQRDRVLAALGMTETKVPDVSLIALATLDLLGDAATRSPLLLLVEDAHWLDPPTCDVLAFVARRLESEPVVLLIAIREGYESSFARAGLRELRVEGLDEAAAGALLDAHAPNLTPGVRKRLLDEAQGNPLALLELPAALGADHLGRQEVPVRLPLTSRLEKAFVARSSELPAAAQTLLLTAAVDDGGELAEVLAATAIIDQDAKPVEALESAIAAGLLVVDNTNLHFRHPLVRSAIQQAASISERQAAHAALAEVLTGQPDRRAWHRAASIIGPNEEIASELEAVADRAQRRGAIAVAVAALERAAALTEDPATRGGRLLRAGELAIDLGRRDLVVRLLREAAPIELAPLDHGRRAWIQEMSDPGLPGDPARVRSLVETADRMSAERDTDLALKFLWAAASSAFWGGRDDEPSQQVVAAAERVSIRDDDPRLLSILAYAAPIERGALVIERLSHWAPDLNGDPGTMRLLGNAATAVGALDLSEAFITASAAGLRREGRLALLAQVLVMRAWCEIHLGRWDVAWADAEEAARLALESSQSNWAAAAQVNQAIVAGLRGDEDEAEALVAQAELVALPIGARAVLCVAELARGLTALGGGRYGGAYGHLRRMFDPTDPSYHRMESCFAIGNLAEAAAHSHRQDEARTVMQELEPLAAQTPSPWFHMAMRHARPLLADDDHAEALFRAALDANLPRWPFDRARALMAYGAWLRRQRRVAESRAPLRAARDTFDALGVAAWSERARQELRASGETSRQRTLGAWDLLSPQELKIARMAAEGLTNREIGQQLYISRRTVGSYLYRIFPKLGVTSRSQLRATLDRERVSPI